jgi:hypothetical protein
MTDTVLDKTQKLFGDMMQIANALADARKHVVDHQVAAQLHRLEIATKDPGRLIASALAAMPKSLRDRLDTLEQE